MIACRHPHINHCRKVACCSCACVCACMCVQVRRHATCALSPSLPLSHVWVWVCACVRTYVCAYIYIYICYLMLLLTCFSNNCNLFKKKSFLFVFLNSFVHSHVTLMVCFKANFLLRTIKYSLTLSTNKGKLSMSGQIVIFSVQRWGLFPFMQR